MSSVDEAEKKRGRTEKLNISFNPTPINSAENTPRHSMLSSPASNEDGTGDHFYLMEASNVLEFESEESNDPFQHTSPKKMSSSRKRSRKTYSHGQHDEEFFDSNEFDDAHRKHLVEVFNRSQRDEHVYAEKVVSNAKKIETVVSNPVSVPAKGGASKKRSKEETKANHRLIERRRTRRINELIQQLKMELMRDGLKVKKDKASILESAVDCIQNLRAKTKDLSQRLELADMRERAFLMSQGYNARSAAPASTAPHAARELTTSHIPAARSIARPL